MQRFDAKSESQRVVLKFQRRREARELRRIGLQPDASDSSSEGDRASQGSLDLQSQQSGASVNTMNTDHGNSNSNSNATTLPPAFSPLPRAASSILSSGGESVSLHTNNNGHAPADHASVSAGSSRASLRTPPLSVPVSQSGVPPFLTPAGPGGAAGITSTRNSTPSNPYAVRLQLQDIVEEPGWEQPLPHSQQAAASPSNPAAGTRAVVPTELLETWQTGPLADASHGTRFQQHSAPAQVGPVRQGAGVPCERRMDAVQRGALHQALQQGRAVLQHPPRELPVAPAAQAVLFQGARRPQTTPAASCSHQGAHEQVQQPLRMRYCGATERDTFSERCVPYLHFSSGSGCCAFSTCSTASAQLHCSKDQRCHYVRQDLLSRLCTLCSRESNGKMSALGIYQLPL